MRRLALPLRFLLLLPLLLPAMPAVGAERAPRGMAFLSSAIGREIAPEEVEAVVSSCHLDLVVFDFAWVTFHFPRTDLEAVDALARRLRERGVAVAAMYRPRALSASDADVHFALDEKGEAPAHHLPLCFAHEDSVRWGASWGERILEGCPSIDRIVLYNVQAPCRCERCRDGRGEEHARDFVREARDRFRKVRPNAKVGHVGVGLEYADLLDFVWPFLAVNRGADGAPVDADALVAAWRKRFAAAPSPQPLPLAKICWASATTNTTEDVAAVVRALDRAKAGFVLWYYGWLFHPDDGRYDPEGIVAALGGEGAALKRWLARPPRTPVDPRQWVWFESRESPGGPRLEVQKGRRAPETIRAEADAVLISYLADGAFGALPRLPLSLGDTNRVLLRFPVGKAWGGADGVLRLALHLSEIPPTAPFDVAVHVVTGAWEEGTATWNQAPSFEAEPVATATVLPREGEVSVDLRDLPGKWASGRRPNHGILLKVARPVAAPASEPPPRSPAAGERALDRAEALWPWAANAEDAKRRAAAKQKLVLAVVTASFGGAERTDGEARFLATVLSHPGVAAFGVASFVPVRVRVHPATVTLPAQDASDDPLAALGSTAREAKPPALLVATPKGRTLAVLPSIGTFDHGTTLAFLSGALVAAGRDAGASPPPPGAVGRALDRVRRGRFDAAVPALEAAREHAGARAGEVAYWLAALCWRRGERARAVDLLRSIAPDDPFAVKAAIRLAFPDRVALSEAIAEPALAGGRAVSEVVVPEKGEGSLLARALDALLALQSPDGSWPVAETTVAAYRPGVTTLAAHALLVYRSHVAGARKRRVLAALDRADAWLDENVLQADPRALNSFAAAYHLEYRLAALADRRAAKADVAGAVAQLVGGELGNGAWSYDRRFGETWKGGIGGWPETTRGRAHSMNTALALLALTDARAAGFDVPDDALAAGGKALRAMKAGPARWTYTWPEPRNFESEDASIARAPLCEQALVGLGVGSEEDLRKALDLFMEHRRGLRDAAKLSESWLPPHAYSDYFYFFATYHAARALTALGDARAKRDLQTLRGDLRRIVEPDGTWIDDPAIGKAYGTAMALLVFDLAGAVPSR